MGWIGTIKRRVFGGTPTYDGAGLGRRTLAWTVANPGAVAALAYTQEQLRAKSRDLVRRNAWAAAGIQLASRSTALPQSRTACSMPT